MFIFSKKLISCRSNLFSWSRGKFKNSAFTFNSLKSELVEVVNSPISPQSNHDFERIKFQNKKGAEKRGKIFMGSL